MKMCMWNFYGDRISLTELRFLNLTILGRFYTIRYGVCEIFFHSFQ